MPHKRQRTMDVTKPIPNAGREFTSDFLCSLVSVLDSELGSSLPASWLFPSWAWRTVVFVEDNGDAGVWVGDDGIDSLRGADEVGLASDFNLQENAILATASSITYSNVRLHQ